MTHQLTPPTTPAAPTAGRTRRGLAAAGRVAALLAVVVGLRVAVSGLLDGFGVPVLLGDLLTAGAVLGGYVVVVRAVEKRRPAEVSLPGAGRELLLGGLLGAVMMSAVVGLIAALGWYTVDGTHPLPVLWPALGTALLAGVVEEVALRGVVFRLVEQRFGTWTALAASAVLFGALHLVNPDATLVGAVAIALQAGVLLGLAYSATGRLWVPIGLHVGWNALEMGLFGAPTSGDPIDGLLRAHLSGPTLLSGGDFGVEGSVFSVVVCLVVSGFFLRAARRNGRLVPARRHRAA